MSHTPRLDRNRAGRHQRLKDHAPLQLNDLLLPPFPHNEQSLA